ncbi:hypothetical protein [Natrarchaeobius oligotrophus]|uniref:hypothetical protein n=1 Tax=Natrarchaeobius oligotrophus TaxID=3455743 RepID=UPI000F53267F|nr:hypothetical protein [Natrarchaeobius chitinivorans]
MPTDESGERRLTTDRETIRKWAEEHDLAPVRTTETETTVEDSSNPYWLRTETERTETMETLSWDEFFQVVEENELVIVFHEDHPARPVEVVDRDQAVNHAPVGASELEERLLAGETVTSEVTETTVVERTIVEHATIESEIIDTEVLDSRVVDVDLRSREIGSCDVVNQNVFDDIDQSRFEDMDQLTGGLREELPQSVGVEVDVDEDWSITRELLERATIESRIVDVDVTETDEVESETVESSIEIERVQQALLESDVIETQADPEEIIKSETIESHFHEDDIVRTQINQRRIVEDEVTERKIIRGDLTESEVLQAETRASTPIETAFVDGESLDSGVSPVGVTEYDTETTEAETEVGEDVRAKITDDDEGKPVVDPEGNPVGMVEEVSGGKAYVDPEPGLVDRVKARLGWGNADEEDYALTEENIGRITDEEVELSGPK